jgi:hypothetical protein
MCDLKYGEINIFFYTVYDPNHIFAVCTSVNDYSQVVFVTVPEIYKIDIFLNI